jgi:hypothetical protein
VVDHVGELLAEPREDPAGAESACALPPLPDLLADEKTGLRDIARFLVTPPFSGLYIGKREVSRLARALDLPRGFGDRQQMLVNLLRAAAQYDRLDALFTALTILLDKWQTAYRQLGTEFPGLAPTLSPWVARLAHTQALLAEMGTAVR